MPEPTRAAGHHLRAAGRICSTRRCPTTCGRTSTRRPTGDLARASTIRRMLGTIEHQVAPTAFSVQLADEDAVRCTVGGVELFCDAADAAVTPGLALGPLRSASIRRVREVLHDRDDGGRRRRQPRLLLAVGLPAGRPVGPCRRPGAELGELPASAVVAAAERRSRTSSCSPWRPTARPGWAYYSTHVGSNGGLIDDGDLLSHPGTVVPTFRLDDLVEGPVGFLKMDVEGAEGRVVQGATRLIARDRPSSPPS